MKNNKSKVAKKAVKKTHVKKAMKSASKK